MVVGYNGNAVFLLEVDRIDNQTGNPKETPRILSGWVRDMASRTSALATTGTSHQP